MVKVTVNRSEQSALSKAVKNVKQKLLTTKPKKIEVEAPVPVPVPVLKKTSATPKKKEISFYRGLVYLGHIPHGFYETEMQDYFSQFGKVTRVRLVRSKKTGRSRGYAYVEFVDNEVAKIAAESMNNYLMCGRLLKASYIPPEKRHLGYFSGREWSKQNYPRLDNRDAQNLIRNRNVDNKVEAILVERRLKKLAKMERRLAAAGIKYSIKPVDVPDAKIKIKKKKVKVPSK